MTELGIIVVLDGDQVSKTFPFSDTVGQYLAIKNKEGVSNELIRHLEELQVGVTVSDESLLFILKKKDIDARLMDESKMEEIQSTKPQLLVDAKFADDQRQALKKLRDFAISLSSSKVAQVSERPDLHVIQAINSLDEIDKIANALSSRLREWYGLHFPELENLIDSINGYSQIVMAGKREDLTKQIFEDAGFPESKVEMLELIREKSNGGDISKENLVIVQSLARQILEIHELRKNLEERLEEQMKAIAPNMSAILGDAVGARLLARAGSLQKLASMPASTIQILGAEKALFRALKTGAQPPKHGLLFQHAMVHSAPRWQRGKIARAVAAKAAIAVRVDVYGEGLNETLLEKLNIRIDEISKKYSEPVKREPKKFDDRRPKRFDDRGPKRFDDRRPKRFDDRGPKRFDDRGPNEGRRSMFSATCDQCGVDCELPFRPNQNKPVYCDNCFSKNKPRDRRDSRISDNSNRDRQRRSPRETDRPQGKGKPRKRFGRH